MSLPSGVTANPPDQSDQLPPYLRSQFKKIQQEMSERGAYTSTVAIDPPNIGANATADVNITITNVKATDVVIFAPPNNLAAGLMWCSLGYNAANTWTVRFANVTGVAINDTSKTWRYWVIGQEHGA